MDWQTIISGIISFLIEILVMKIIGVLIIVFAAFVIIRIWLRYRHYKKRDPSSPPESHALQYIINTIVLIGHHITLHPENVKQNLENVKQNLNLPNIPMVDTSNIDLQGVYVNIHTITSFVFIYLLIMTHIDIVVKYWVEFQPWRKAIYDWSCRYPWVKSIYDWFYRHRAIFDWFRRIDNKIDDVIAKEKHVPPR